MNTDVLEKIEQIIVSYRKKNPYKIPVGEVKALCSEFALMKNDEELLDYLGMMDEKFTSFDFRLLLVEIYESL